MGNCHTQQNELDEFEKWEKSWDSYIQTRWDHASQDTTASVRKLSKSSPSPMGKRKE